MSAFQGWEVSAAWEDFKFGMKHFSDIERLAMVGEEKWQHGMATFYKPRDYCSIFLVGYSLASPLGGISTSVAFLLLNA